MFRSILLNLTQKTKNEKWYTYFTLFVLGGILTFTALNLFLPLAIYTLPTQLFFIISGLVLFEALLFVAVFHWTPSLLKIIKTHWRRNSLIAGVITLLILSILPDFSPYKPITHQIRIETNSPGFGLHWIETDHGNTISIEKIAFTGQWEETGEYRIHTGDEYAAIEFQSREYVRHHRTFLFHFLSDTNNLTFSVFLDGEIFETVEIAEIEKSRYNYQLIAPPTLASNGLWHAVCVLYPIANAISVFLVLLYGVSIILDKPHPLLIQISQISGLSIVFYIFWMALAFNDDLLGFRDGKSLLVAAVMIFFFLFIPILYILLTQKKARNILLPLTFILLLSIGLRIYWIIMVPTAQVSDFGRFHTWALQLANNEPGLWIDRYADFTRALSLLYRIYPSHISAEVMNIGLAMGTCLSLYFIGKINQKERMGLIAAYFLAIHPTHIGMTSIVNTDIPSTFFLVLSVLLTNLAFRRKKFGWVVLAGLAFSLCTFLRGAMLVYFPVLFVMLFLPKNEERFSKHRFITVGTLLTVFLVTGFLLDTAIDTVQVDDMMIDESRYLMWPLIKGTNIEKLGRDNYNDSMLVASWPEEDVTQLGIQEIRNRLFPDPIAFYKVLDKKFEYLLANATYTGYLAFLDENNENRYFETGWNAPTLQVREIFAQLSQYTYLIILLLALIAVVKANQRQATLWVPSVVILLCAVGAYTFFEVQPRYSFPLIPFLILLAGMAFTGKESTVSEK